MQNRVHTVLLMISSAVKVILSVRKKSCGMHSRHGYHPKQFPNVRKTHVLSVNTMTVSLAVLLTAPVRTTENQKLTRREKPLSCSIKTAKRSHNITAPLGGALSGGISRRLCAGKGVGGNGMVHA